MTTGSEDRPTEGGRRVRIYRPARSAMQSGEAATRLWVLEFAPETAPFIDPLMGWVGSADPSTQVRLSFPTREDAVEFARRQGWVPAVEEPHDAKPPRRSYADNFTGTEAGDI